MVKCLSDRERSIIFASDYAQRAASTGRLGHDSRHVWPHWPRRADGVLRRVGQGAAAAAAVADHSYSPRLDSARGL